jgi:uncharacterized protein YndB with AHSA1/START domain
VSRALRFETIYPHSPERVWRALTSSTELAEWLMDNDFEPRVGHKFHFRTKARVGFNGIIPCEVLEVEEPRLLSFAWGTEESVVRLTLEPTSGGTRLILQHEGFRGLRGLAMHWVLGHGWRSKIEQRLPATLSRMSSTGASETKEN